MDAGRAVPRTSCRPSGARSTGVVFDRAVTLVFGGGAAPGAQVRRRLARRRDAGGPGRTSRRVRCRPGASRRPSPGDGGGQVTVSLRGAPKPASASMTSRARTRGRLLSTRRCADDTRGAPRGSGGVVVALQTYRSGDNAGAVPDCPAAATGGGGVISSLGRLGAHVSAAGPGAVRAGAWWSLLGRASDQVERCGGAPHSRASTACLGDQAC